MGLPPAMTAIEIPYGEKITLLPKQVQKTIQNFIESIRLPPQVRDYVHGHGLCIGATYGPKGHKIAHTTGAFASLAAIINTAIQMSAPSGFEWTSLQINYDTVSEPHVDQNNKGKSLLMLLGEFEGG